MERFGKYEIVGQLGSGTVGTVYQARDSVLQRGVALKLLNEIHADDPELKERFYREARACARLKHPGIVSVYDFGESDGIPYMVMELLEGQDLRAMRASGGAFTAVEALEIMAQVSAALAHAHRAGIVHRDVKPSNIFIQHGVAKVLDFGIARLADSELTRAGRALGTPDYMAPEQILGRPCESRSDLFSAAIVAFELLSGVHPFRDANIPRRIVQGIPERLDELKPDLPTSLGALFEKALSAEPGGRFQNGDELAEALRSAVAEVRATSHATRNSANDLETLFQRAAGKSTPNEPEVAALGAPALGAAGPLPPGPWDATRIITRGEAEAASGGAPATEPPSPQKPSRKRNRWPLFAGSVVAVLAAAAFYFGIWQRETLSPKSPPISPPPSLAIASPVAAARVLSPWSKVYDRPGASGRRLATLARGAEVAITRLPLSMFQEWVAVQVRSDRNQPVQGYARMTELGDWSSNDPARAILLLEVFAPVGTDAEARADDENAKLDVVLSMAADGSAAARAHLDRAALYLWLARSQSRRGLPFETWRTCLDSTGADLASAASDPSLRAEVASARAAVNAMMPASPEPSPIVSASNSSSSVPRETRRGYRADLVKVEEFWRQGRYEAASRELSRYEAQHPADPSGRAWRERLGAADRLEKASEK